MGEEQRTERQMVETQETHSVETDADAQPAGDDSGDASSSDDSGDGE